jgi:hypothetical protein
MWRLNLRFPVFLSVWLQIRRNRHGRKHHNTSPEANCQDIFCTAISFYFNRLQNLNGGNRTSALLTFGVLMVLFLAGLIGRLIRYFTRHFDPAFLSGTFIRHFDPALIDSSR